MFPSGDVGDRQWDTWQDVAENREDLLMRRCVEAALRCRTGHRSTITKEIFAVRKKESNPGRRGRVLDSREFPASARMGFGSKRGIAGLRFTGSNTELFRRRVRPRDSMKAVVSLDAEFREHCNDAALYTAPEFGRRETAFEASVGHAWRRRLLI